MAQAVKVGNVQIGANNLDAGSAAKLGVPMAKHGADTSSLITVNGKRMANPAYNWKNDPGGLQLISSRYGQGALGMLSAEQKAMLSGASSPTNEAAGVPQQVQNNTPQGTTPGAQNVQNSQSYEQAQQALAGGGLSGDTLAAAQQALAAKYNQPVQQPNKYQQGLAAAEASGTPAPANAGTAAAASFVPQQQDQSGANMVFSQDPVMNQLMGGIAQLLSPEQQTNTLMDDYQKLYKSSGLGDINKEMIDAETVINGTEDDIRNEVQSAGGMGTDSQIQAMSLARNKSLVTRYNQLVQMQTNAQNQLNTMLQIDQQDRSTAQQKVNTQITAMFNMANYRQQALNNTQEQVRWLTQTMGADGLYNAYKNSPDQLSYLEQTLGLAPGGLKTVAAQAASQRLLDTELKNAQIASAERANRPNFQFVPGTANQPGGTFDPSTGTFTPFAAAGGEDQTSISQGQDTVNNINSIVSSPHLGSVVSPTGLGQFFNKYGSAATTFGGASQNLLGSINELTNNLTLEKLQQAKQNGATFGALSEGEENLVASAASKLGSWAVKDKNGNVTGYRIDQADFKKELDTIKYYQVVDSLRSGADPSSLGLQQTPDGWLMPLSDGSWAKIKQ